MPLLLKTTIDSGIMSKNIDNVLKLLLCQLIFFVGFATANTVSSFISTKITLKTSVAFLLVYLEKVIKLPMQYFEVSQRTELLAKVSDLSRIQSFFTDNFINILFALVVRHCSFPPAFSRHSFELAGHCLSSRMS